MSRIHGRANRIGEYHRKPMTIVATAEPATAQGFTPVNVSGPRIAMPASCGTVVNPIVTGGKTMGNKQLGSARGLSAADSNLNASTFGQRSTRYFNHAVAHDAFEFLANRRGPRRRRGRPTPFSAIHGLVRQPVGIDVVLSHAVTNLKVFQLTHHLLGLVIQLSQSRILHLLYPLYLPDHQF